MTTGRFIAGIAALIWNPVDDTYLLLRRSAQKDYGAGLWECVTGRVDQGEGFEDALHREIREELGVAAQLEFVIGTSHFYRGEPVPEHELLGVVYCCTLPPKTTIQISAEHDAYRWVTAAALDDLFGQDGGAHRWIRHVIDRAEVMRRHQSPALRAFARMRGFETNGG
jgi:8-oxo-dGTP diphosphatase